MALAGCAMLALGFALTIWEAARLTEQGRSPRAAWQWRLRSPFTWMALVLVVGSVSPPAGAALFGIVMLATLALLVVFLVRGVRGLPAFARQVRRIGEPDAWRGTEPQRRR
jgi:hypothetical protein